MIHHVFTNTRQSSDYWDLVLRQVLRRANPREHQDLNYVSFGNIDKLENQHVANEEHQPWKRGGKCATRTPCNMKATYESITSFFARTRKRGLSSDEANSTPMARGLDPEVSKMIRVALAFTATVKLGRESTSGVRYAESMDTRRPLESMNVTIKAL